MPVALNDDMLMEIRKHLPELPEARRKRFVQQYGLPEYDAGVLVADAALASYYERAAASSKSPKTISNWVMTELLGKLTEARLGILESPIAPEQLAELVVQIDSGRISGKMAKEVFAEMFASRKSAGAIIQEKGLAQVSDSGAMEGFVDEAILKNPKSVADFKSGNQGALNFLKGQVMKLSKGRANPQLAGEILLRRLQGP